LAFHPLEGRKVDNVIEALTTKFYSHVHMISRDEAREILGEKRVHFVDGDLGTALDALLRRYEDDFLLRTPFFIRGKMGDDQRLDARFLGSAIESAKWGYVYETKAVIHQHSKLPPNVQVQLPPGQVLPIVPGLPREFSVDLTAQGWIRNKEPIGVTL
jgi:hypothetical protein